MATGGERANREAGERGDMANKVRKGGGGRVLVTRKGLRTPH